MRTGPVIALLVGALLAALLYVVVRENRQLSGELADMTAKYNEEVLRTQHLKTDVLALEAKHANSRREVRAVLDAHPDWSGAPTPAAIADSLCRVPGVRCAAGTVRTPTD